jgi:hypothetical protein
MKTAYIATIIIAVLIGLIIVYTKLRLPTLPSASEKEQAFIACINSGGTVKTSLCCNSASDFPNNCLIGACGCSPENSHEVKVCDCGSDRCFDGNTCTSSK